MGLSLGSVRDYTSLKQRKIKGKQSIGAEGVLQVTMRPAMTDKVFSSHP